MSPTVARQEPPRSPRHTSHWTAASSPLGALPVARAPYGGILTEPSMMEYLSPPPSPASSLPPSPAVSFPIVRYQHSIHQQTFATTGNIRLSIPQAGRHQVPSRHNATTRHRGPGFVCRWLRLQVVVEAPPRHRDASVHQLSPHKHPHRPPRRFRGSRSIYIRPLRIHLPCARHSCRHQHNNEYIPRQAGLGDPARCLFWRMYIGVEYLDGPSGWSERQTTVQLHDPSTGKLEYTHRTAGSSPSAHRNEQFNWRGRLGRLV